MGGKAKRKSNSNNKKQSEAHEPAHLKLDTRGDGMYSGTFRWLETKQFPSLGVYPNNPQSIDLMNGWEGFLRTRHSSLLEIATANPSCLDALSFPVTFLHVATRLHLLHPDDTQPKHLLILGASSKAEQRIWRITAYWEEIAAYFSNTPLTLWFIGPEVKACNAKSSMPSNLSVQHFRGTFGDFLTSSAFQQMEANNTIIIGYNTGFGNFIESEFYGLLLSWLPDLYAIAASNIPAIFTCANDYADMNGEFAVQLRVIGSNFLLLPQQNPFSAASHLHEKGKQETAWSRANSFLYVIQGIDARRQGEILQAHDLRRVQKRLETEDPTVRVQDRLGRHFYQGVVLSKEQAAKCDRLTIQMTLDDPDNLQTPQYDILPGVEPQQMVIVVHVPLVQSTDERIAVDLRPDATFTVAVPKKYYLTTKLPFPIDGKALAAAQLIVKGLPSAIVRVICKRKT